MFWAPCAAHSSPPNLSFLKGSPFLCPQGPSLDTAPQAGLPGPPKPEDGSASGLPLHYVLFLLRERRSSSSRQASRLSLQEEEQKHAKPSRHSSDNEIKRQSAPGQHNCKGLCVSAVDSLQAGEEKTPEHLPGSGARVIRACPPFVALAWAQDRPAHGRTGPSPC